MTTQTTIYQLTMRRIQFKLAKLLLGQVVKSLKKVSMGYGMSTSFTRLNKVQINKINVQSRAPLAFVCFSCSYFAPIPMFYGHDSYCSYLDWFRAKNTLYRDFWKSLWVKSIENLLLEPEPWKKWEVTVELYWILALALRLTRRQELIVQKRQNDQLMYRSNRICTCICTPVAAGRMCFWLEVISAAG